MDLNGTNGDAWEGWVEGWGRMPAKIGWGGGGRKGAMGGSLL